MEPDECIVFGCAVPARHGYPMCPAHSDTYHYGDGQYRGPALQLDLIRAICGRVGNCWEHRLACSARGYTRVRYMGRHWPLHRLAAVLDAELQCGPAAALAEQSERMVLHDRECEYLYRRGLLARRCVNPAHLRWGGESPGESARENAEDIHRVTLMLEDHDERGYSDLEVYRRHGCAWQGLERIESPPVEQATYDLAEALAAGDVRALGRSEG